MTENLKSAAVSDRGLSEKRPQNEDSYLEMPERGLFAVADGVGGAQAGEVASQMAVEILGEAFANLQPGGDAEDLMKVAIERANEAIHQMSSDLPQLSSMATTVVALHVDGNIATIGHVGDSRLYRVDGSGNLFRETQDHSVVEEEVRAGRMTAAQAANHPSRNVISRALGADNTVQVDLKTIMVEPNTSFLLCSDGITRHIEDNEIRQLMNSDQLPEQICEQMKYICYGRGAEDNLTAVVIRVNGVGAHAAVDTEDQTVSTARPALVGNENFTNAAAATTRLDANEIPELENKDDFETKEFSKDSPLSIASTENNIAPVGDAPLQNQPVDVTNEVSPAPADIFSKEDEYTVQEKNESGFFGKFLSALALLLLGAALGAGGYYYLKRSQPEPTPSVVETPKISEMKSPNIAYTSFEDNRRNVDKNPAQYISANSTNPEDSEDFYLLGRAHLVQGNYVPAKENFEKAKQKLDQSDTSDKQMLANEINFGLSIVDSPYSKRFLDGARTATTPVPAANSNSNSNTQPDTEIKPLNQQPQNSQPPFP